MQTTANVPMKTTYVTKPLPRPRSKPKAVKVTKYAPAPKKGGK